LPHRYGNSHIICITQCYLTPGICDIPALTIAEAGTRVLLTAVLFVREVPTVIVIVANPACWNTEAVVTREFVVSTCYSYNHNTHTIDFTRTHLVSHLMRVA